MSGDSKAVMHCAIYTRRSRKRVSNNPSTRSMRSAKRVRLLSLASVTKAGGCCPLAMTMVDTQADR
jgi:hypothetical protein